MAGLGRTQTPHHPSVPIKNPERTGYCLLLSLNKKRQWRGGIEEEKR
jgi:hypothetical protein